MDLQKEFADARSEAVVKQLKEANMNRAKYFLDNFVVPELCKQKALRPCLNYYSVTFHVENGEAFGYTTYASKHFYRQRHYKEVAETESTLIAATVEANAYKINPVVFEECDENGNPYTAYRFEIRLF